MKDINSLNAPKAVGPYSQAIEHAGVVYCSGQIGIDPQSGVLEEGVEKQARRALTNLRAVLESAGLTFSAITMVTVYLQSMNDYSVMNDTYASMFTSDPRPARVTVAVAALPKNALVEISCIATRNV